MTLAVTCPKCNSTKITLVDKQRFLIKYECNDCQEKFNVSKR